MSIQKRTLILGGIALLLFAWHLLIVRKVSREPLEKLWEEHMLAGTGAIVSDGRSIEHAIAPPYEWGRGGIFSAGLTRQGIMIGDYRERRFLGLWLAGGWGIHGGPLWKFEEKDSTIELYGKQIIRRHPSFILNLRAIHIPNEEYSFEFFLLHRKRGASHAILVKKWAFGPDDLYRWKDNPPSATGLLEYTPVTQTATVTIKGLKRPFEESIDLSKVLVK